MLNIDFVINFKIFFLIFSRILGIFLIAPILGNMLVSFRFKIALTFLISFVIFPILSKEIAWNLTDNWIQYLFLVINQFIAGFAIGFFTSMLMSIFQLLGQLISIQIGFSMGQIIDPMIGDNSYVLSQFFSMMGIFIFLYLNGHIIIIEAVYDSFFKINFLDFAKEAKNFVNQFTYILKVTFEVGLKLSLPILGPIFLIYISMGILAKFAPQMNILMIGFPTYIIVGLLLLIIYIPYLFDASRIFLDIFLKRTFNFFG